MRRCSANPTSPALFTDHVHPNDRGYQIIGHEWFRAITTASVAAARFEGSVDLDETLFTPPAPAGRASPSSRAAPPLNRPPRGERGERGDRGHSRAGHAGV